MCEGMIDEFTKEDIDGASMFLDEEGFLGNPQETELHDALCRKNRAIRLLNLQYDGIVDAALAWRDAEPISSAVWNDRLRELAMAIDKWREE